MNSRRPPGRFFYLNSYIARSSPAATGVRAKSAWTALGANRADGATYTTPA